MSITQHTTIWCDACGEWMDVPTHQKNVARAVALRRGWVAPGRLRNEHYCPRCVKEEQEVCDVDRYEREARIAEAEDR